MSIATKEEIGAFRAFETAVRNLPPVVFEYLREIGADGNAIELEEAINKMDGIRYANCKTKVIFPCCNFGAIGVRWSSRDGEKIRRVAKCPKCGREYFIGRAGITDFIEARKLP